MSTQYTTIKGHFNAAHRELRLEKSGIFLHGHTFNYELTFGFSNCDSNLAYVDHQLMKSVFPAWVDECLNHGIILNPEDKTLRDLSDRMQSKTWIMSLFGVQKYCDPTPENVAKEIFLAMKIICQCLFHDETINFRIYSVKISDNPENQTICYFDSISFDERLNFYELNEVFIKMFAEEKQSLFSSSNKNPVNFMGGHFMAGYVIDHNGNKLKVSEVVEPWKEKRNVLKPDPAPTIKKNKGIDKFKYWKVFALRFLGLNVKIW